MTTKDEIALLIDVSEQKENPLDWQPELQSIFDDLELYQGMYHVAVTRKVTNVTKVSHYVVRASSPEEARELFLSKNIFDEYEDIDVENTNILNEEIYFVANHLARW